MSRKIISIYVILIGVFIEVTWIAGIVSGPDFSSLLRLTNTQLGIILGSLNIGLFIFSPVAGKISSRLGSSRVLTWGVAGMILGTALVLAAFNYPVLFTGMVITGVANAFVINANMTILSGLFPDMIRRIISLYSAIYFGACSLFSPVIGHWLRVSSERGWHNLSFRVPFFFLMLVFIYFGYVTARYIVPSLGRLMPVQDIPESSDENPSPVFLRWFWVPLLSFFHGLMYIVMVSWLSPMAMEKFGANEFQGSLFVGVATMGMGVGRLSLSFLWTSWEDRKLLAMGTIIGGFLLLSGLFVPSYALSLLLIGIGSFIASCSFPCISALGGQLFPNNRAKVFGYMYATYAVAGILGTPLAGILADRGISLSGVLSISAYSALLIGAVSLLWKRLDTKPITENG
jgi:MFS family permease